MDPTTGALIGAIVTALGLLAYNYHRPRVDYAKTGNDALVAAMNELQEERTSDRARIAEQDQKIATLARRVEAAETDAREAKQMTTYAVAENAQLTSYVIATARGVMAGTVPPWLDPKDYDLHARLSLDDFPVVPDRDTGVPGVDLNPPPTSSGTQE